MLLTKAYMVSGLFDYFVIFLREIIKCFAFTVMKKTALRMDLIL